jgi:phage gp29-like protein
MSKVLDRFGNPVDTGRLKENQTARVGALHSTFAGHPSRGLTPPKLARILESAELGDFTAQHDLFLDMEEKDAHIFAEMSKRKRTVLTLDWNVVPPQAASNAEIELAAYAKDMLEAIPNLEDVFLDALDAIGHGFACLEIEWQRLGREWLPKGISHRPQSWFQMDHATRSQLRLRDNTLEGQELQRFGWITHLHKAKSGYLPRAGLHRVLAWPFLFKNYSVRDLAEFLEIYGMPLRLGTYPHGSNDDEKAALMRAVTQIGHDAAGIIPEGMMIDFKEAASGTHEPFQAMIDWCERSQSKAILGGTLTSQADGKSSTNALGTIHNEVRHDLLVSDALQLGGTLTRDLVYPLLAINKTDIKDPRRLPRLVFDVREPADFQLMADALPKLVAVGMPISVQWVRDKLRIPQPVEGEAVLARVQQPAPDLTPAATTMRTAAGGLGPLSQADLDEIRAANDELARRWEQQAANSPSEENDTAIGYGLLMPLDKRKALG